MGDADAQVTVRFTTQLSDPSLHITDSPMAIPTSLTRWGLSEVVNHLLAERQQPQPFDFLIEGELLRSTLSKHLASRKISVEAVVTLEYILAVSPPQPGREVPHEDWVSSVSGGWAEAGVVTGCYDGVARLWDPAKGACRAEFTGHTDAVTAVAALAAAERGGEVGCVVSASKDGTLRSWAVPSAAELRKGAAPRAGAVYRGHTAAVQAVALAPDAGAFCSGAWDGSVRLWRVAEPADEGSAPADTKRRKKGSSAAAVPSASFAEAEPTLSLEGGHSQCVAGVAWHASGALFTGALDHSVRVWDAETGANTSTLHLAKAVHAVCASRAPNAPLVAFGGADRALRLWDPRNGASATTVTQLTAAHLGWITAASFSPASEHHLVSASYDGTLKLWDVRGKGPLHTLGGDKHQQAAKKTPQKLLAADWAGPDLLAFGGADATLHTATVSL